MNYTKIQGNKKVLLNSSVTRKKMLKWINIERQMRFIFATKKYYSYGMIYIRICLDFYIGNIRASPEFNLRETRFCQNWLTNQSFTWIFRYMKENVSPYKDENVENGLQKTYFNYEKLFLTQKKIIFCQVSSGFFRIKKEKCLFLRQKINFTNETYFRDKKGVSHKKEKCFKPKQWIRSGFVCIFPSH